MCGSGCYATHFFVFEEKIMNGSMGNVIDIVYDDPKDSRLQGTLPLNVVVDFKEFTLSYSFIPGIPPTYITIPITTERFERK